jgi:hypothetical protein
MKTSTVQLVCTFVDCQSTFLVIFISWKISDVHTFIVFELRIHNQLQFSPALNLFYLLHFVRVKSTHALHSPDTLFRSQFVSIKRKVFRLKLFNFIHIIFFI